MPIITKTVNINNLKATSAKSISQHTIRNLVKYSLKNVAAKAMFTLTVSEILPSEGRSILSPVQRGIGSERVTVMNNLFLYFETLGAIFSKEHLPEIASEKNRADGNVINGVRMSLT